MSLLSEQQSQGKPMLALTPRHGTQDLHLVGCLQEDPTNGIT